MGLALFIHYHDGSYQRVRPGKTFDMNWRLLAIAIAGTDHRGFPNYKRIEVK